MDCTVHTLSMRCPTTDRERSRRGIEEALRTGIKDDRRLWLIRHMRVADPVAGVGHHARERAVQQGWLAAVGDARHGASEGCAQSNCVWFESREEAVTLLLRRLMGGQAVDAWFWPLAVPDWRRRSASDWLAFCVQTALAEGNGRLLMAVARTCMEAGAEAQLLASLGDPLPKAMPWAAATDVVALEMSAAEGIAGVKVGAGSSPLVEQLAQRVAPLPGRLRALVSMLTNAPQGEGVALALARQWLITTSPALTLAPTLLTQLARHALSLATKPPMGIFGQASGAARAADQTARAGDPPPSARPAANPPHPSSAPSPEPRAKTSGVAPEGRVDVATVRRADEAVPADMPAPPISPTPLFSAHAGLWLVVPTIADLGFAAWLRVRPERLVDHPGRQLLTAIATHHRIDPRDPALAMLGGGEEGALPDWTHLWRRGVDGWLRKTARRRLHDLLHRPGNVLVSEDRLDVHFPSADADIALRLLALDRDPGWTPWLGLSIRFHFDGEALSP